MVLHAPQLPSSSRQASVLGAAPPVATSERGEGTLDTSYLAARRWGRHGEGEQKIVKDFTCISPGAPMPASGDCMSVGPKTRAMLDSGILVTAAALASLRRWRTSSCEGGPVGDRRLVGIHACTHAHSCAHTHIHTHTHTHARTYTWNAGVFTYICKLVCVWHTCRCVRVCVRVCVVAYACENASTGLCAFM